jgi:hypothetical protein
MCCVFLCFSVFVDKSKTDYTVSVCFPFFYERFDNFAKTVAHPEITFEIFAKSKHAQFNKLL